MNIKKHDLKIISHLRKNSRESLTTLSRKTNIPVSTLFDKVKNKTGYYIKKIHVLLIFQKWVLEQEQK
jgi:DNA-binding Lrp family transcriptional regulator